VFDNFMNHHRLHQWSNNPVFPAGSVSSTSSSRVTTVRSSGGSTPVVTAMRYPVQTTRLVGPTYTSMPTTYYSSTAPSYFPSIANIPVPAGPSIPAVPVMGCSAKMGIAQGPQEPEKPKTPIAPQLTYRTSSAMNIGHVRCEGVLGLAEDLIIEALNVYVGTAPFHLTDENLEITAEGMVVARDPNIRFLLEGLGNETLTLAQLKSLSGLQMNEEMWLGLPGQPANLFITGESGQQVANNASGSTPKSTTMKQECVGTTTTSAN
ncbi:MAG: hypothetical protein QWI73_06910, partial [Alphaproteobacteria bacterium]|nr:hypothetical protein [Alphaproteobacteria bacterium]